jgi:hypothetical protein
VAVPTPAHVIEKHRTVLSADRNTDIPELAVAVGYHDRQSLMCRTADAKPLRVRLMRVKHDEVAVGEAVLGEIGHGAVEQADQACLDAGTKPRNHAATFSTVPRPA